MDISPMFLCSLTPLILLLWRHVHCGPWAVIHESPQKRVQGYQAEDGGMASTRPLYPLWRARAQGAPSGEDTLGAGLGDHVRPAHGAELPVDALPVRLDRAERQIELERDLLAGKARRNQMDDL